MDLGHLSGLEQTKASRLNRAKLVVFYLEACEEHSTWIFNETHQSYSKFQTSYSLITLMESYRSSMPKLNNYPHTWNHCTHKDQNM